MREYFAPPTWDTSALPYTSSRAAITRRLRGLPPRSYKTSHRVLELLDASVKVFILERDRTLTPVTNELCIIAKPSKGSRMLVPAVDTDNRDRRVIKACFPHGKDPASCFGSHKYA
jgi:hypothetical protein